MSAATPNGDLQRPSGAAAAVLKPSDPVPEGAKKVQGIDFNDYAGRSITVEDLIGGMANMGFQASSVGDAVRIINGMVSSIPSKHVLRQR
jgi:deoxyhypusine synthase